MIALLALDELDRVYYGGHRDGRLLLRSAWRSRRFRRVTQSTRRDSLAVRPSRYLAVAMMLFLLSRYVRT